MDAASAPAGWLRRPAAQAALVAAAAVACYADTFTASFHFDDFHAIVQNPALRDWELFRATRLGSRVVGYLSFALDWRLFGLDVRGWHAVNLAIHVATALLLYALARLLFRTPALAGAAVGRDAGLVALFAALLFAVHPVQTQAVTYVVQRLASLSTLFSVLASAAFVRWRLGGGAAWASWALALAATLLALFTKESAATLPLLLVLCELAYFEGDLRRRLARLAPFLLAIPLLVAAVLRAGPLESQLSVAGPSTGRIITHAEYLATEMRVAVTYLRLLLWPSGQTLFYDYPIHRSFADPRVLASLALLLGLGGLAAWLLVRHRGAPHARVVAFGIAWFLVALSVESGAVVIVDVIYEHRLYYPSAGAFLAAAAATVWAARAVEPRWPRAPRALALCGAAAVAVLGVAAFQRNRVWADDVSLWEDVVRKAPGMPAAQYALGLALADAGLPERAEEAQLRALALNPYFAESYQELARLRLRGGRQDRAWHAMAVAAWLAFDTGRALELWGRALALSPGLAEAHYGRALALASRGDGDGSRDELELGCRLGSERACRARSGGARDLPAP